MIPFLRDIASICRLYRRSLLTFFGALLGLVVVVALFFSWQTTRSEFCDACHYMDPYVKHWRSSSHADISCAQCHDYGVGNLAVSAMKYWTGTYNSRPKSNVPDANCLSSECHEAEMLAGKVEYGRGIMFDHEAHLEKPLRGEKLRCTSCHNQIVQYDEEITPTHMAVNDRSCFVCHFKDAGQGEAITGCDACHGMPKQEVEHEGYVFDHEPYLRLDVECKQCHTRIVKGDGAVPEARCHSCHIERSAEEVGREGLHAIHVTEEGIDCFRCHSDIEHGNFEMVGALEVQCDNCHSKLHNSQKQLYMGVGGRDTLDIPSDMFTAQVSCVGCHTHETPNGDLLDQQSKKQTTRASCVTCHGEDYDLMFDNWASGSKRVLADYRNFLRTIKSNFRNLGGKRKARVLVQEAISQAEYNYDFISDGHLQHNISYGLYLLNNSADRVIDAMRQIQKSYAPPDRGAAIKAENSCQAFCHGKAFFPESVDHDGDELPHRLHVEDMELGCAACHSIAEHGQTEIQSTVCEECH